MPFPSVQQRKGYSSARRGAAGGASSILRPLYTYENHFRQGKREDRVLENQEECARQQKQIHGDTDSEMRTIRQLLLQTKGEQERTECNVDSLIRQGKPESVTI